MKAFGSDMSKWYIMRSYPGRWSVCPPVSQDDPDWYRRGGTFKSGAEALAAFAAGGRDA